MYIYIYQLYLILFNIWVTSESFMQFKVVPGSKCVSRWHSEIHRLFIDIGNTDIRKVCRIGKKQLNGVRLYFNIKWYSNCIESRHVRIELLRSVLSVFRISSIHVDTVFWSIGLVSFLDTYIYRRISSREHFVCHRSYRWIRLSLLWVFEVQEPFLDAHIHLVVWI